MAPMIAACHPLAKHIGDGNLQTFPKLAITPILATLALAGVAGAGWRGLTLAQSAAEDLNSARLPATELVGDLALRILQVREEGFKVLTFTEAGLNPAHINKFVAELQAHISATRALLNEQSQAAIWHEDERRAFVVIAQRFDSFSRAVLDATDIRDTVRLPSNFGVHSSARENPGTGAEK